jgi:mono/diheme cytochrome c family protein
MTRIALATLLTALLITASVAQDASVAMGRASFIEFCAVCHGEDATGERSADNDTRPAPDLTGIAERNSGTFPRERVRRIISGLEEIPGHGERMPAWGLILLREAPARDPAGYVESRIEQIVDYLASIQSTGTSP